MTTEAGTRLAEFDVATLRWVEDEHALYRQLRAAGPVAKGGLNQWVITRHADVSRLLRDRRLVHRMPREYLVFALGDGAAADFRERSLLNRDGPDHTRLRILMGKAFSAPLVRGLRDHIADLVDGLIEPLLDGAPFDVVQDLALPLPTQVICELLGIDRVDRAEVAAQSAELFSPDRSRVDAATDWIRGYIGGVLAERRADPDGDLLQRMLAAEDGVDALTHAEIVDNAAVLFVAGFETTRHLVAAGVSALLDFGDQLDLLLDDPSLASSTVEEVLRFDGPAANVTLVATEPIEVGAVTIKPDRVLALLLRCANRDEDVFADPDRLDITRTPNPHVAFGGGVHHCLGAMLARVEGEVVFRRLAERVGGIERDGEPELRTDTGVRQLTFLPVAARPR